MPQVLRNNDNKILKNSDGKLLKANYDFGYAFKGRNSKGDNTVNYTSNNRLYYVRVPEMVGKPLAATGAIEAFFFGSNLMYEGVFNLPPVAAFRAMDANLIELRNYGNNAAYRIAYPNSAITQKFYAGFSWKDRVYQRGYSNAGSFASTPGVVGNPFANAANLTAFEIAYADSILDTTNKCSTVIDFRYYERELPLSELQHTFNSGLGNEPLSGDKLKIWFTFARPEILTFTHPTNGPYQAVGVRNKVGNSFHGEIMGLPAGTLEEQLAWAQTNLFTLA